MWLIHSASLPGRSFRRPVERKPRCGDRVDAWLTAAGRPVLCVADGVSEAGRGPDAARLAVSIATQITTEPQAEFADDPAQSFSIFHRLAQDIWRQFVQTVAKSSNPDEWLTTFTIATVVGHSRDVFFATVGDSAMILGCDQSNVTGDATSSESRVVFAPTRGGEASVPAVLGRDYSQFEIHRLVMPNLRSVVISTDGLELLVPEDHLNPGVGLWWAHRQIEEMTQLVRDQEFGRLHYLLERGLILNKPDDYGVAIAAWR